MYYRDRWKHFIHQHNVGTYVNNESLRAIVKWCTERTRSFSWVNLITIIETQIISAYYDFDGKGSRKGSTKQTGLKILNHLNHHRCYSVTVSYIKSASIFSSYFIHMNVPFTHLDDYFGYIVHFGLSRFRWVLSNDLYFPIVVTWFLNLTC